MAADVMNLDGATIAVTGATGFLGRYLVRALLLRRSRVIGVVRNPDRVPELARHGVELRKADLREPARLAEGFAGAEAVVSNAALFSLRNMSWKSHHGANITGTRNVFEAAAQAGVRRIVQVSSVAVYQGGTRAVREDHRQHTESSSRWPWRVYRISKALSEQLAWRLAAEHGVELTTVRPCGIYGAFDPNFIPMYRRLVEGRVYIKLLGTKCPLVYAGDVAEGIALCLERPVATGKAYNLTGDLEPLRHFVDAWPTAGGATGRVALPVPLPVRISAFYDNSSAKRDLGWTNRSYHDGLRDMFALEREGGDVAS
jgi:nucleoside-diphosphate-sugar epimerase